MEIDENSMSYQRLLTHLRFALNRLAQNEPFHEMDEEMLNVLKVKYKNRISVLKRSSNLSKMSTKLIFQKRS